MSDPRTSKNIPLNQEERDKLQRAAVLHSAEVGGIVTPTTLLRQVGMVGVEEILAKAEKREKPQNEVKT